MTEPKEETIWNGGRELKFRLYRFPNGDKSKADIVPREFHYSIRPDGIVCLWWHNWNSIASDEYYQLVQYTWLKDKNGFEIYEGDIVKRKQKEWWILEADKNEYTCFIEWDRTWRSCRKNRDHVWFTFAWEHIEVIWNIYENPELLAS